MEKVWLKCGCCGGEGRVEMTGKRRELYDFVLSRGRVTGASASRYLGRTPSAVGNDLLWMWNSGLLSYEWYGRRKFYRVID